MAWLLLLQLSIKFAIYNMFNYTSESYIPKLQLTMSKSQTCLLLMCNKSINVINNMFTNCFDKDMITLPQKRKKKQNKTKDFISDVRTASTTNDGFPDVDIESRFKRFCTSLFYRRNLYRAIIMVLPLIMQMNPIKACFNDTSKLNNSMI